MRRLPAPLVALLLGGCSSAAGPPSHGTVPTTTHVVGVRSTYSPDSIPENRASSAYFNAPPDSVRALLPGVYAALGLDAGVVDPSSHAFGVRDAALHRRLADEPLSTFVDCGANPVGVPAADSYRVLLTAYTQVPQGSAGAEVRSTVTATATPRGTSGTAVTCTSTGELEKRLAAAIRERLGG